MNGEVQLVVGKGVSAATYTQWLNQPINVDPASQKMYISQAQSPNFNCAESQLLLDTIESQGGLTVEIFDLNGNSLGTAFLNTLSDNSVGCGGKQPQATIKYTAAQTSNQVVKTAYFIWTDGGGGGEFYILDLFENETISQTWKYQDLNNFTAQGAFSREFRVPFSDTNQKALGALFDNNSEQGADNYFFYKLPAQILVDTLPIASGYIQVRRVYRRMNRINEVELAFFAETPDLVKALGEKKLADIAALTELNEIAEYTTVTVPNVNRIWTLCDRAQLWSGGTEAGTRPIASAAQPVLSGDLTPAVSWWFLLENIINEAGFELVAGSLENLLKEYWMPFINSQVLLATGNSNQYFFKVERSGNVTFNGPTVDIQLPFNSTVFDNSAGFNTTTFYYVPPGVGTYTFRMNLNFTVSALGGSNTALISFYAFVPGGNPDDIAPFPEVENTFGLGTHNVDCFFEVTTGLPITFGILGAAPSITINTGGYVELTSANVVTGQVIDYRLNAPDMRQVEFVSDVIKMHNCAIVPSRSVPNRIGIVPQNSYIGTGDLLDWTEKLDLEKDVIVSSTVDIQRSKFRFTYTLGDDYWSQIYSTVKRIYGDYEAVGYTVNPNTLPSDFAIGEQKVELITRSTPCGQIPNNGSVIPMFYNDSLEFTPPGPRCLFNANTVSIRLYKESTGSSTFVNIPTLCHYSNTFPTVNDTDLNWAPEVPPHASTVTANPYNNLFNQYWRAYLNTLYSPEARVMEAHFALDLKDIIGFRFSDKIWIQDSYWRILEISDYKVGLQESTKVKLLKYLEAVEDCSVTPASVNVNGLVNFENYVGDPAPATEDCCSRYGYFWDEANGVCWAFNNGGQIRVSPISGTKVSPTARVNKAQRRNASVPNSTISGTDVLLPVGAKDTLAVGENLEITKAVGATTLVGKNVYTSAPGLHIGGGYRDGTAFIEKGWAQAGLIIFSLKDTYLAAGNKFLFIEGISGEHLEIPDDTVWSCLLHFTAWDTNLQTYSTGQYSFAISKVGGVAAVSAITPVNTVNTTAYTFTVGVNVAVTNLHRIFLNVGGAGSFPVDVITTASLQYQQSKIS
jgi:hypothetical protein